MSTDSLAGTVFAPTLRGVRCIRLSVMTDETTSPNRQREASDQAAAALGITFGEGDALREAVDLDVSASKIGPFDRPQLGAWLARPEEYDVLVWWRFDRAIRSMQDMHELAKWAKQHRKMLVFAEGIGGGRLEFDFRNPMNPMSELMMMMLAFAAQVETQSTSDRVSGAQAAMRKMPLRWPGGGKPPYGYMPIPMPEEFGGVGWTLAPDPDTVKVLEYIISEVLDNQPLSLIAAALNLKGEPAPLDHWAIKKGRVDEHGDIMLTNGKKRKRARWTGANIARLLRYPALLGWKMHKDNPVRDANGVPVMAATSGILERAEFDRIAAVLDARKTPRKANTVRSDTSALLLGVAHCFSCKGRIYRRNDDRQAPHYNCTPQTRGETCPAPIAVRASWIEEFVEQEFLKLVGGLRVRKVIEIPGYDPQPEINETLAEFREHQEQKGRQRSKSAQREWQERADALDARLAELEEREPVAARREVIETERTYADEWTASDTNRKRAMLIEAGARLEVRKGKSGGWRKLDVRRMEFTMTGEWDPAVEALTVVTGDAAAVARNECPSAPGARIRRAAATKPVLAA
ncbi:recombinase family protein [Streptomyces sp. NPDC001552]|uniref:recombinase family protein n=1 Tax=Streptomyces sp. NPDC001552 TaxID=3364587 RepID=UPI0036C812EC